MTFKRQGGQSSSNAGGTQSGEWMPYMVLEWLEGRPLDRILDEELDLERPPWTFREVYDLLVEVAAALEPVGPERTLVIVGHQADEVRSVLPPGVESALQEEQNGTGDAVRVANEAAGRNVAHRGATGLHHHLQGRLGT